MVFRLDSDSTVPMAIAALSSGAKVDQVPRPRTKQPTSRFPVQVRPRSRSPSAGVASSEGGRLRQFSSRPRAMVTRPRAVFEEFARTLAANHGKIGRSEVPALLSHYCSCCCSTGSREPTSGRARYLS